MLALACHDDLNLGQRVVDLLFAVSTWIDRCRRNLEQLSTFVRLDCGFSESQSRVHDRMPRHS